MLRGYLAAQAIREQIDVRIADSTTSAAARGALTALRGEGAPEDGDLLYGSITAVPPQQETIVGLQEKFLFMLNLLQSADAKPTSQALGAVGELQRTLEALTQRHSAVR